MSSNDLKELANHLAWICPVVVAALSSDPSKGTVIVTSTLVGWASMIVAWNHPSETAKKAALLTFPIGILIYWLMDVPNDEAMGIALIIYGAIPCWVAFASMGGSSPNADGRDSGGSV